jgi:septum formation protein
MKYKIILASASPRRRELLKGLELDFEVRTIDNLDESYPPTLPPLEVPLYIATQKADAYKATMKPNELIITADTVVLLDGQILEKPNDQAQAINMLQELSGREHHVITGVVITTRQSQKAFSVTSSVTFDTLLDKDITHYVQTYNPLDKAGAYGIQEWIGYIGVKEIHGSFYNVMGLPVQRLYQELQPFLQ